MLFNLLHAHVYLERIVFTILSLLIFAGHIGLPIGILGWIFADTDKRVLLCKWITLYSTVVMYLALQ